MCSLESRKELEQELLNIVSDLICEMDAYEEQISLLYSKEYLNSFTTYTRSKLIGYKDAFRSYKESFESRLQRIFQKINRLHDNSDDDLAAAVTLEDLGFQYDDSS